MFLLLEDESGLVNVVVRPDLHKAQRSVILGEPYLCIEGKVQLRSGTLNVIAAAERNGMPRSPNHKREAKWVP